MAFCRYCGKQINEGAIFCIGCGRRLKEDENNTANTEMNRGSVPPPIPDDYIENEGSAEEKHSNVPVGVEAKLSTNDTNANKSAVIPGSPAPQMSSGETNGMGTPVYYGGDGSVQQGYPAQQSGQIPQAYPIYQGGHMSQPYQMYQGQMSQVYSVQPGAQMAQGYPMQQNGQIPQGYPMQQSGQIPQGYPMQQSSQIPQGYPMQQSGSIQQGYGMPQYGQYNPAGASKAGVYSNNSYSSNMAMNNEVKIETIIDGEMGQILKVYSEFFIVETTEDFELLEPDARKIYQTKGASENEKGVLEEFADVGREMKSIYGEAFAMFGEAFSSSYAEKRKKKLGVLTIPVGERKVYYAACSMIEGINVGQEKRGYISIKTNTGEEILFFFDGNDEDIDDNVTAIYNDVLQPRIYGQTVNHNASINKKNGSYTSQQPVGDMNYSAVGGDKVEQIKRLKDLLDSGAISKKEFARMKKDILKK